MAFINEPTFSGAVKPSAIEVEEHENILGARRIMEIPSNLQMRVAYNASNQEEYIGYAGRGVASSESKWLLQKLTYTSGLITLRQIAYDSWDNRATATYA